MPVANCGRNIIMRGESGGVNLRNGGSNWPGDKWRPELKALLPDWPGLTLPGGARNASAPGSGKLWKTRTGAAACRAVLNVAWPRPPARPEWPGERPEARNPESRSCETGGDDPGRSNGDANACWCERVNDCLNITAGDLAVIENWRCGGGNWLNYRKPGAGGLRSRN